MKDYKGFMSEAISAARLAQLAAKGKGAAAAQKMAADGLKPGGYKKPGKGGALATVPSGGGGGGNKKTGFGNTSNNRKRTPHSGAKPDGVEGNPKWNRKMKREDEIQKIKDKRGKKLKKTAKKVGKYVLDDLKNSSKDVSASGAGASTERGVRYQ